MQDISTVPHCRELHMSCLDTLQHQLPHRVTVAQLVVPAGRITDLKALREMRQRWHVSQCRAALSPSEPFASPSKPTHQRVEELERRQPLLAAAVRVDERVERDGVRRHARGQHVAVELRGVKTHLSRVNTLLSGVNTRLSRLAHTCSAWRHRPPRSHALISVLNVTTFTATWAACDAARRRGIATQLSATSGPSDHRAEESKSYINRTSERETVVALPFAAD